MSKTRTFLDAGVLLAAARLKSDYKQEALDIINDPVREFISSDFVRLETELKCDYYGYQAQIQFYASFFTNVQHFVSDVSRIVNQAYVVGKKFGLNALDALHISAALLGHADEFITTERPDSPFKNVTGLTVFSLHK